MTQIDSSSFVSGIQLVDGKSASEIFYDVIAETVTSFPQSFPELNLPDKTRFRKHYLNLVPRIEAARIASPQRAEIARHLSNQLESRILFQAGDETTPLSHYLEKPAAPLPVKEAAGNSTPGWQPNFTYQGQDWNNLASLADLLYRQKVISSAARLSLESLQSHMVVNGSINLSGRKVVVIGANAEMAPTSQLLEAGADLLWLDVVPPDTELLNSPSRAGKLTWVDSANLLQCPAEILATMRSFAGDDPLDVCLYAYAPGQARELKLTVAMNAIVNALPAEMTRSLTLLLSPTTATPLSSEDLIEVKQRRHHRPRWEAMLDAFRLLGRGEGTQVLDNQGATRTIVAIQGASYQAAQYLGKLMQAEAWSAQGLRVSANTAAITKTRSMNHPVFDAGFDGAGALQVVTFTPPQSQCMSGMLAVHDWLNPEFPQPGKVRVHGGIHTLPYPLNSALRVAAAIGFVKTPGLLTGLFR